MKLRKWFWGLFFILAGGLFLANALEIFTSSINLWSLSLTVFLAMIVMGSLIHFNFGGILIPLALIATLFAKELNITNITPWPLIITAILVSIGLEIIFSKAHRQIKYVYTRHDGAHENFSEVINENDNDEVSYHVNFGAGVKYVNSDNFKKGYFSCKFGALKIYFDNTKPYKNEAEIIVNVSFGAAELYIPKEWNVIIDTNAMLGSVEEKNCYVKSDGPKIILKGNVSLAAIEITYV